MAIKRGLNLTTPAWFTVCCHTALVAEALKFWDALRAVGTSAEVGMFAGPVADRPHLQNWSDAGIDMASRLVDLLTRSGTMRWAGQQQRYRCDLGLRGELFPVGNASQVWNRQATVTVDMLTRARAASAAAAPGAQHFRNAVQPGASTLRAGAPHPAAPSTPAITQADITAKRQELRRHFVKLPCDQKEAQFVGLRPRH
jgi:hypothetical protein